MNFLLTICRKCLKPHQNKTKGRDMKYPIILDGATGTQLQKRGFDGSECAEKWILDHPKVIEEIQEGYIKAGSDIIYAPTFGANHIKLAEYNLENELEDINRGLVELSKKISRGRALVAGDMAPTGHFLEPIGDMQFEQFVEAYKQQAQILDKAGVDLFVIETSMTLPEVRAAILAIKEVSGKPIFVTFSCDENGKTLTGTDVVAALAVVQEMGIAAFGLNCSSGPKDMLSQIKRLHKAAKVPLIAKPNAGMPRVENGQTVYDCTPEEFVSYTEEFAKYGVRIFGGCCGSDFSHIEALKKKLSEIDFDLLEDNSSDLMLCATETAAFEIGDEIQIDEPYSCDEDLADNIDEAMDSDSPVIAIRFGDEDELENFTEAQYMMTKPLYAVCDDAKLLEKVLRLYQGRALCSGNIPEEELRPLVQKYGVIVK